MVGGDVVKVDFFYTTPAGPQHQRAAAPLPTASPAPRSLRLLPVLLPAPGSAGRPGGVDGHSGRAGGVGLQLQLGGLLSGRGRPRPASPVAPYENAETTGGPAPQPTMTRPAYLRWELRDAAGDVVQSDVVEVPTTEAGRDRWQHFSTAITVDKGPDGKLNGTLNVQLLNEGSQPVYFDSLTIRHPQPALLVSQENHYYPFGMNLSGVAVNTRPAEALSKRLYNGGSELEDELLGAEGGNYSTFYRRYDATIGRFLGVDALADVYDSQTPFGFASNDPVNGQDPTGAYEVDGFGNIRLKGGRGHDSFGFSYSNPHTDPTGSSIGMGVGSAPTVFDVPEARLVSPWASISTFDLHTAYGNEYWMSTVAVKALNQFVPGLEAFRRNGSFGYYSSFAGTPSQNYGTNLPEAVVGMEYHSLQAFKGSVYSYTPPPAFLPGFPDANRVRPKGGRPRWNLPDGDILEWDRQHGELERYNPRGKHKGVWDPNGNFIKDPVPGRKTPTFTGLNMPNVDPTVIKVGVVVGVVVLIVITEGAATPLLAL